MDAPSSGNAQQASGHSFSAVKPNVGVIPEVEVTKAVDESMVGTIETVLSSSTRHSSSAAETSGEMAATCETHQTGATVGTVRTMATGGSDGALISDHHTASESSGKSTTRASQSSGGTHESHDKTPSEASVTRLSQELLAKATSLGVAMEGEGFVAPGSNSSQEEGSRTDEPALTAEEEASIETTKKNLVDAIEVLEGLHIRMGAMSDSMSEASQRDTRLRANYEALCVRHEAAVKSLEDINQALQHDRDRLRAENERLNALHKADEAALAAVAAERKSSEDGSVEKTIPGSIIDGNASTGAVANTTIEALCLVGTDNVTKGEEARKTHSSDGIGSGGIPKDEHGFVEDEDESHTDDGPPSRGTSTRSVPNETMEMPWCGATEHGVKEGRKSGSNEGRKSGEPVCPNEGQKTGSSDGRKSDAPVGTNEGRKSGISEDRKSGEPVCPNEGRKTSSSEGRKSKDDVVVEKEEEGHKASLTNVATAEDAEKPQTKMRIKELEEMRASVEDLKKGEESYQVVLNVVCQIRTAHLNFKEKMAEIDKQKDETAGGTKD